MFEKSFTLVVTTDGQGHFHSSQPVTSPFSLDVKISATVLSPAGITLQSSFALGSTDGAAADPIQFTVASGETVDLGKWSVIAGEDANVATATGFTEPATADTEISVQFVVSPSFF
jgi:hypothetical protein